YLQHVRGFAPCSLCIFIRLDVLGLVLAGIVGSLAPRSRIAGGIAALVLPLGSRATPRCGTRMAFWRTPLATTARTYIPGIRMWSGLSTTTR
ncbi:disulfide bond formation protein B, partial [Escherichia coli]|uniref:disulfide bond formation protein B n=1 Tax=Escherichia coli TaxID=562 RepID=UPI0027381E06